MEFKVGQRFRVPNITWTIEVVQDAAVLISIEYHNNSKPAVQIWRSRESLDAILRWARILGRLIEDHVTVEE